MCHPIWFQMQSTPFFLFVHFHMFMNSNLWVSFNPIIKFPHAPLSHLCGAREPIHRCQVFHNKLHWKVCFDNLWQAYGGCHKNYWVLKDNWVAKLNLGKNLLHGGGLSNFWMVKIGVDFVYKLMVGTKCCHLSWILYKNILIE